MITPDLIDILAEKTVSKPDTNSTAVPFEDTTAADIMAEKPTPNISDFEPEPTPEPIAAPKTEVELPKLSFSEQKETAKMVVATYDAIQTLSFPYLYKKSLFSKKELKQLQDIKVSLRQNGVASLTEKEQILYDKYTTLEDLSDSVGFTEEEANLIIEPLAKVFQKYNISLGPELVLIGALMTISAPRFLPFFSPLEKL